MAELMRIADNREGYRDLVDFVMNYGVEQASRNGPTLEVNDMVIELDDPTKSIPCGINRKGYSLALGLLEGLQLVAAKTCDDLMVRVAPNTSQFREDDGRFHGGYGRRINAQMPLIVDRLRADPDTRQAVVTLWDPELDARGGKRDHPCTCLFNWRVRDNRLLMSTYMRSQDVHWGWPYDVVMFTTLHLTMASFLGIEAGPYTHHAASFHIYTRDLDALDQLEAWDGYDVRLQPLSCDDDTTWRQVMHRAEALLLKLEQGGLTSEDLKFDSRDAWYYDTIKKRLDS